MNGSYEIVRDIERWVQICTEWSDAKRKSLDFETCPDPVNIDKANALRPEDGAKIAGIAIAWLTENGIKSAYCTMRHWRISAGGDQVPARKANAVLSDAIKNQCDDCLVVVHNIQMEAMFMLSEGIVWPKKGQFHDLMIAARVLNMGVTWKELIGLKSLQAEYLNRDMSSKNEMDAWLTKNRFKKGADIWRAPVAIAGVYAQDDARDTLEIWLKWEKAVYQKPTMWWWDRKPNRSQRFDLYELEVETAINACLATARGNRVDYNMCRRRGNAATALQNVCTRWIRWYLEMPTINPGSTTQMKGLLFSEAFGLKVSMAHLTASFHKLPDREQTLILSGKSKSPIESYASLDVEALSHYAKQQPQHSDLFFMLAIYRKCAEAIKWFVTNFESYSVIHHDRWYDADEVEWLYIIYHRLKTVGTVSGRMSAGDFNVQGSPKRYKMLMDAETLIRILSDFLPPNQLRELLDILDTAQVKEGDESKILGLNPGDTVFDFSSRAMFIPRPGKVHRAFDLSQVEMRLFAHYSGNRLLCGGYGIPKPDEDMNIVLAAIRSVAMDGVPLKKALRHVDFSECQRLDRQDQFDIHGFVATELAIARKPAKGINFGIVYGMGKRKLSRSLGLSVSEGKAYLAKYHARLPEIEYVQAKIKVALRDRGFVFDNAGRRYYLPVNRAYIGLNRLIQGLAATIFKIGFVRNCELFSGAEFGGSDVHPITQRRMMSESIVNTCIHDEVLTEYPKELNNGLADYAIRSNMSLVHGLKVPLGTSSEGSEASWDECSAYETDNFCGLIPH